MVKYLTSQEVVRFQQLYGSAVVREANSASRNHPEGFRGSGGFTLWRGWWVRHEFFQSFKEMFPAKDKELFTQEKLKENCDKFEKILGYLGELLGNSTEDKPDNFNQAIALFVLARHWSHVNKGDTRYWIDLSLSQFNLEQMELSKGSQETPTRDFWTGSVAPATTAPRATPRVTLPPVPAGWRSTELEQGFNAQGREDPVDGALNRLARAAGTQNLSEQSIEQLSSELFEQQRTRRIRQLDNLPDNSIT